MIENYEVFHLCSCGKVISHSQAEFDAHKFHGEKFFTWPIGAYRRYKELLTNAKKLNKPLHPDVLRDLLTNHCVRERLYKSRKKAFEAMSNMVFLLDNKIII